MSNTWKYSVEEIECDGKYVPELLKILLHTIIFHRSLGPKAITPLVNASIFNNLFYISSIPTQDTEYEINKLIWDCIDKTMDSITKRMSAESVQQFTNWFKLRQQQKSTSTLATSPTTNSIPILQSQPQKISIEINFYDNREVRNFLFKSTTEEYEWEKWTLQILVKNGYECSVMKSRLQFPNDKAYEDYQTSIQQILQLESGLAPNDLINDLEKRMKSILKLAQEKVDHLPSTTPSKDGNSSTTTATTTTTTVSNTLSKKYGDICYPFKITIPNATDTSSHFLNMFWKK